MTYFWADSLCFFWYCGGKTACRSQKSQINFFLSESRLALPSLWQATCDHSRQLLHWMVVPSVSLYNVFPSPFTPHLQFNAHTESGNEGFDAAGDSGWG